MTDYLYYTEEYGGSMIPEDEFIRCEKKAAAYLDYLSFGRAAREADGNLKAAACALAELYYLEDIRGGKSSEDTDGYRISWDTEKAFSDQLYQTALIYLANSGLCYRGAFLC